MMRLLKTITPGFVMAKSGSKEYKAPLKLSMLHRARKAIKKALGKKSKDHDPVVNLPHSVRDNVTYPVTEGLEVISVPYPGVVAIDFAYAATNVAETSASNDLVKDIVTAQDLTNGHKKDMTAQSTAVSSDGTILCDTSDSDDQVTVSLSEVEIIPVSSQRVKNILSNGLPSHVDHNVLDDIAVSEVEFENSEVVTPSKHNEHTDLGIEDPIAGQDNDTTNGGLSFLKCHQDTQVESIETPSSSEIPDAANDLHLKIKSLKRDLAAATKKLDEHSLELNGPRQSDLDDNTQKLAEALFQLEDIKKELSSTKQALETARKQCKSNNQALQMLRDHHEALATDVAELTSGEVVTDKIRSHVSSLQSIDRSASSSVTTSDSVALSSSSDRAPKQNDSDTDIDPADVPIPESFEELDGATAEEIRNSYTKKLINTIGIYREEIAANDAMWEQHYDMAHQKYYELQDRAKKFKQRADDYKDAAKKLEEEKAAQFTACLKDIQLNYEQALINAEFNAKKLAKVEEELRICQFEKLEAREKVTVELALEFSQTEHKLTGDREHLQAELKATQKTIEGLRKQLTIANEGVCQSLPSEIQKQPQACPECLRHQEQLSIRDNHVQQISDKLVQAEDRFSKTRADYEKAHTYNAQLQAHARLVEGRVAELQSQLQVFKDGKPTLTGDESYADLKEHIVIRDNEIKFLHEELMKVKERRAILEADVYYVKRLHNETDMERRRLAQCLKKAGAEKSICIKCPALENDIELIRELNTKLARNVSDSKKQIARLQEEVSTKDNIKVKKLKVQIADSDAFIKKLKEDAQRSEFTSCSELRKQIRQLKKDQESSNVAHLEAEISDLRSREGKLCKLASSSSEACQNLESQVYSFSWALNSSRKTAELQQKHTQELARDQATKIKELTQSVVDLKTAARLLEESKQQLSVRSCNECPKLKVAVSDKTTTIDKLELMLKAAETAHSDYDTVRRKLDEKAGLLKALKATNASVMAEIQTLKSFQMENRRLSAEVEELKGFASVSDSIKNALENQVDTLKKNVFDLRAELTEQKEGPSAGTTAATVQTGSGKRVVSARSRNDKSGGLQGGNGPTKTTIKLRACKMHIEKVQGMIMEAEELRLAAGDHPDGKMLVIKWVEKLEELAAVIRDWDEHTAKGFW